MDVNTIALNHNSKDLVSDLDFFHCQRYRNIVISEDVDYVNVSLAQYMRVLMFKTCHCYSWRIYVLLNSLSV